MRPRWLLLAALALGVVGLWLLVPGRTPVETAAPAPPAPVPQPVAQPVAKPRAPERGAASVSGHVYDAAGEAVAGAGVELSQPGRAPRTVRSGGDGEYRFDAVAPGRASLATPGASTIGVELDSGQHLADVDLLLAPDDALSGRVVDPEGYPIPGARLAVEPGPPEGLEDPDWRSGADGGFRIEPGRRARALSASASGFTRTRAELRAGPTTLVLWPGGAVTVEVREDRGGPAAECLLALLAEPGTQATPRNLRTGADGRATFEDVRAGRYRLLARGATEAAASLLGVERGDVEIDVRLGPGNAVSGRVVREDGRGVSGAVVKIVVPPGAEGWRSLAGQLALSGVDGAFTLAQVPPGPWTLTVVHGAFAPATRDLELRGADLVVPDLVMSKP